MRSSPGFRSKICDIAARVHFCKAQGLGCSERLCQRRCCGASVACLPHDEAIGNPLATLVRVKAAWSLVATSTTSLRCTNQIHRASCRSLMLLTRSARMRAVERCVRPHRQLLGEDLTPAKTLSRRDTAKNKLSPTTRLMDDKDTKRVTQPNGNSFGSGFSAPAHLRRLTRDAPKRVSTNSTDGRRQGSVAISVSTPSRSFQEIVAPTGRCDMPILRLPEQIFGWLNVAGPRVALPSTRGIHGRNPTYTVHN